MSVFQIVVITAVVAVSFAVIGGFVAMVVVSNKRSVDLPRRSRAQIAAGWYPDAADESLLRYFDGRQPTLKTSRRDAE